MLKKTAGLGSDLPSFSPFFAVFGPPPHQYDHSLPLPFAPSNSLHCPRMLLATNFEAAAAPLITLISHQTLCCWCWFLSCCPDWPWPHPSSQVQGPPRIHCRQLKITACWAFHCETIDGCASHSQLLGSLVRVMWSLSQGHRILVCRADVVRDVEIIHFGVVPKLGGVL